MNRLFALTIIIQYTWYSDEQSETHALLEKNPPRRWLVLVMMVAYRRPRSSDIQKRNILERFIV